MKTKTINVINSFQAFDTLISKPLPSALSFKLARGMKVVSEVMETFQATQRKIVESWSQKDEAGKPKTAPGNPNAILLTPEGQKELQSVFEVEVELPFEQIKITDLGDITMSPIHYLQLDWLITE